MHPTLGLGALLILLGLSAPARADQCAWNPSRRLAIAAARQLAATHHIQHFCAPCGDAVGVVAPVERVTTRVERASGRRYHVVVVNGEDVDLAYVYLPETPTTWRNVGLAVGCGASDVPAVISSPPQPPSPSTSADANGVSG
ncbi:MAG: hypothetical protein RLZZ383_3016 [Pseudomonadota bacterium]|jgi:hypothetical protein